MNKYYIEKATGNLFFALYETIDTITLVDDNHKNIKH